MSFREKSAWISVISMAGIYGLYFWSLIRSGHTGLGHTSGLLGTVIALVSRADGADHSGRDIRPEERASAA